MLKQVKLKPSQVNCDHSYQRPVDEKRVAAIVAAYDPERIGVPTVSIRKDGSAWWLDGQHRGSAIVGAGQGEMPIACVAFEELTLQQEAQKFLELNAGRLAVDSMATFKARLVAKEPVALEVNTIVRAAGMHVTTNPGPRGICAIRAVEWVHRHRGNLDKTLAVLRVWAEVDARALDGYLIKAVSIFLAEYPQADAAHLAKRLTHLAAGTVIAQIKTTAKDFPVWVACCLTLRKAYNTKGKSLPPLAWMNE